MKISTASMIIIIMYYNCRGYDIRIGDNCGPLLPVSRDSLSYKVAEDITVGLKRKRYLPH